LEHLPGRDIVAGIARMFVLPALIGASAASTAR
jgi:hypothetical protein